MIHLAGTEMNLKTKSLYATRFLEPESLGVKLANDGLIEIVYQCRKQKEYGVLCHERLGEPVPAESVVHIIEYTLFCPHACCKNSMMSLVDES